MAGKLKIRIAVTYVPTGQWTANAHYLKNVLSALRSLKADQAPEVFLLVPAGTASVLLDEFRPWIDGVLEHELFPPWAGLIRRMWRRIRGRFGVPEQALSRFLRSKGIHAVFGGMEFGEGFRIPLVTWVADFQHIHLPDMFSKAERLERDHRLMGLIRQADRVVVNSRDVLEDVKRFAPADAAKVRVVSFVSLVEDVSTDGPGSVCASYHLPEKFVYLPNQFWRHKNHGLVLEALALLKAERHDMTVVCTGNTNDYRAPGYFGTLLADLSRKNLRGQMILLGTVPHEDVFRLLRQSVAVLQPSLFEGWNTAIEECKSEGKAMIVSDLAVHREQNPPKTLYFSPADARALADCLIRAYEDWKEGPDDALEAGARADLPVRQKEFAGAFMKVIGEITDVKQA